MDELNYSNFCKGIQRGWIWYCDEHQDHGTADTVNEAKFVGKAHSKWDIKQGGEGCHIEIYAIDSVII
jgi:hypothetical protein